MIARSIASAICSIAAEKLGILEGEDPGGYASLCLGQPGHSAHICSSALSNSPYTTFPDTPINTQLDGGIGWSGGGGTSG